MNTSGYFPILKQSNYGYFPIMMWIGSVHVPTSNERLNYLWASDGSLSLVQKIQANVAEWLWP